MRAKLHFFPVLMFLIAEPFFLSFSVNADAAQDFATRAKVGNAATDSLKGLQYMKQIGPVVGDAMSACVPRGSTTPENLRNFTLIADVTPEGRICSMDFKPKTKVSACFAEHFGKTRLPASPNSIFNNESGFPITIDMHITP